MRNTNHSAHTLRLGIEVWVTEQTACESRNLRLPDVHVGEAVPRIAQITAVETKIECEEGGAAETAQEGDDLVVLHSFPSNVVANLTNRHPPTAEEMTLTGRDVFVQNNHAGAGSSRYSWAWSTNA